MEIKKVGNIVGQGKSQGGGTFLTEGISPALLSGMSHGNVMPFIVEIRKVDSMYEKNTIARAEQLDGCVRLGNAYNNEKFTGGNYGGNVWDVNGLAPTMKTGASASQQCTVEVKKMEQQIVAMRGRVDNNVIIGSLQEHAAIKTDGVCTSLTEAMGMGGGQIPMVDEVKKIKIRQATKNGFIDCEIGGVADLNYPSSQTRRGRVVEGGANKSNSDNGEYP